MHMNPCVDKFTLVFDFMLLLFFRPRSGLTSGVEVKAREQPQLALESEEGFLEDAD